MIDRSKYDYNVHVTESFSNLILKRFLIKERKEKIEQCWNENHRIFKKLEYNFSILILLIDRCIEVNDPLILKRLKDDFVRFEIIKSLTKLRDTLKVEILCVFISIVFEILFRHAHFERIRLSHLFILRLDLSRDSKLLNSHFEFKCIAVDSNFFLKSRSHEGYLEIFRGTAII